MHSREFQTGAAQLPLIYAHPNGCDQSPCDVGEAPGLTAEHVRALFAATGGESDFIRGSRALVRLECPAPRGRF